MIPHCPIHLCKMRGKREPTPSFTRTWKEAPATRIVYRCTVKGCPRIECEQRTFYGSSQMRVQGEGFMTRTVDTWP